METHSVGRQQQRTVSHFMQSVERREEDRIKLEHRAVPADCGHPAKSGAVRIHTASGWVTVCIQCWHDRRSYFKSLSTYGRRLPASKLVQETGAAPAGAQLPDRQQGNILVSRPGPRGHRLQDEPARPRVLIYSHDTYGLGHLRRNLAIAEHLLGRLNPFSVRLLSGSPVIQNWPVPSGLEVTPMPPVVKTGPENYRPREGHESFQLVKAYREAVILKTVMAYRPDVLLVDHAPAGMGGELLPALSFIGRELKGCRRVLGLRDILDSAGTVRQVWQEQGIYDLLEAAYEQILVYGSQHLFDVSENYQLPRHVAAKTSYCGYVARKPAPESSRRDVSTPVVLVTAGGGGDGFSLMSGYLSALEKLPAGTVSSLIITGPLMDEVQRRELQRMAGNRCDTTIMPATADLPACLGRADMVVCMGGYNTSVEVLAARKPAILVPRSAPRAEQRIRAAILASLGLVEVIQPEDDLAGRLAELIPRMLSSGRRPPPTAWESVDLGGTSRVAAILESLCRERVYIQGDAA